MRKRRGDVALRGFASRCGGCGSAEEEISFLLVLEEGGDGVDLGAAVTSIEQGAHSESSPR